MREKAFYEKRNEEIQKLYKEGKLSQREIGEKYGIQQSYVSAIIWGIRPTYRVCTFCKAHIPLNIGICRPCIERRKAERQEKSEKKRLALHLIKLLKKYARERARAERRVKKQREYVSQTITELRACFICRTDYIYQVQRNSFRQRGERGYVGARKTLCEPCAAHLLPFEGRERTREARRMYDKHTCRGCGKEWNPTMRRFDIHHTDDMCGKKSKGYDSMDDFDILITLCHKCHFNRHDFSSKKENMGRKKSATIIGTNEKITGHGSGIPTQSTRPHRQ